MGRLVYFMPGHKTAPLEKREAWGLGYVGGGPFAAAQGPTGEWGVLFTHAEGPLSAVDLRPERWHQVHGTEAWVSVEGQVEPRDLRRSKVHSGHAVELADGQRWIVPAVRLFESGRCCFPRALAWDGKAWAEGEIEARYADLWSTAEQLWDDMAALAAGGKELRVELEIQDLYSLAASALGVNYRVGFAEVSALGLLNTGTAQDVALAVVDWPTVEAALAVGKPEASAAPG